MIEKQRVNNEDIITQAFLLKQQKVAQVNFEITLSDPNMYLCMCTYVFIKSNTRSLGL